MSALPPIADIGTQSRDVRFVPKADIPAWIIEDQFGRPRSLTDREKSGLLLFKAQCHDRIEPRCPMGWIEAK
jgi:hypothetical protein